MVRHLSLAFRVRIPTVLYASQQGWGHEGMVQAEAIPLNSAPQPTEPSVLALVTMNMSPGIAPTGCRKSLELIGATERSTLLVDAVPPRVEIADDQVLFIGFPVGGGQQVLPEPSFARDSPSGSRDVHGGKSKCVLRQNYLNPPRTDVVSWTAMAHIERFAREETNSVFRCLRLRREGIRPA